MSTYADLVCVVCQRGDNEAELLICDGGCERGFHIRCINLAAVPVEDWCCVGCANSSTSSMQVVSPEKEISTVYLYERVSSKGQNEPQWGRVGMESQNSTLLEFCLKKGLIIKGTVREVVSARNPANLQELRSLIKKLKSGDTILVYSASRFCRHLNGGIQLLKEIHARGAKVYAVSEECSSFDQKFLELVKEAQAESDRLSLRVRDSIKRMKQLGAHIGKAPFGWSVTRDHAGVRRLVKNEIETNTIEKIKMLYRQSQNLHELAGKMNRSGALFRGKLWRASDVRKIVKPFQTKKFTTELAASLPQVERIQEPTLRNSFKRTYNTRSNLKEEVE